MHSMRKQNFFFLIFTEIILYEFSCLNCYADDNCRDRHNGDPATTIKGNRHFSRGGPIFGQYNVNNPARVYDTLVALLVCPFYVCARARVHTHAHAGTRTHIEHGKHATRFPG